MSHGQSVRTSRFRTDIECTVASAATAFRDSDMEASIDTALRLWWTSRLRGRRFAQLVTQARHITQERISLGVIQHGQPGRRQAMPYFFAVLRDLIAHDSRARRRRAHRGQPSSPQTPHLPVPAGTRLSDLDGH